MYHYCIVYDRWSMLSIVSQKTVPNCPIYSRSSFIRNIWAEWLRHKLKNQNSFSHTKKTPATRKKKNVFIRKKNWFITFVVATQQSWWIKLQGRRVINCAKMLAVSNPEDTRCRFSVYKTSIRRCRRRIDVL